MSYNPEKITICDQSIVRPLIEAAPDRPLSQIFIDNLDILLGCTEFDFNGRPVRTTGHYEEFWHSLSIKDTFYFFPENITSIIDILWTNDCEHRCVLFKRFGIQQLPSLELFITRPVYYQTSSANVNRMNSSAVGEYTY